MYESLTGIARDSRLALRSFRRSLGFAITFVLTLGLGLGVNAAIFATVDSILWRPLNFADPDRLVQVMRADSLGNSRGQYWPGAQAQVLHEQLLGFENTGRLTHQSVTLTGLDEPLGIVADIVTHGFFDMLGVSPVVGRGFVEDDVRLAAEPVTVLTHDLWQSAFGRRDVLGESVRINDIPYTIVGVLGPDFKLRLGARASLYLPMIDAPTANGPASWSAVLVGRLLPDVTQAGVAARIATIGASLTATGVGTAEQWRGTLRPIDMYRTTADRRATLLLLLGTAGTLLMIGAVNLVNLVVVRQRRRQREFALRASLGAGPSHLLQSIGIETLLLGFAGGVVAILFSQIAFATLMKVLPSGFTAFSMHTVSFEPSMFFYMVGLSLVLSIFVTLFPTMKALRGAKPPQLQRVTVYGSADRSSARVGTAVVIAQVGLTMTLAVGATLFVRSFTNLLAVDAGFDVDQVAFLNLSISSSHATATERRLFLERVRQEIHRAPGVDGVAIGQGMPPNSGFAYGISPEAEGIAPLPTGGPQLYPNATVDSAYFRTLGVPILSGRSFVPSDGRDARVVDEDFARWLWGGENPVGRRFRMSPNDDWLTVVGVAGDMKLLGQDDRQGQFELYDMLQPDQAASYMSLAVRIDGDPSQSLSAIREAVYRVDANQPISKLETAHAALADSRQDPRFNFALMISFTALAVMLASVGIFGVLSVWVTQRQRELGIRVALGAKGDAIRGMVVRQAVVQTGIGVALGAGLALVLSKFAATLLFQIAPHDPLSYLVSGGFLMAVAILASYLPALRATRADPLVALRME